MSEIENYFEEINRQKQTNINMLNYFKDVIKEKENEIQKIKNALNNVEKEKGIDKYKKDYLLFNEIFKIYDFKNYYALIEFIEKYKEHKCNNIIDKKQEKEKILDYNKMKEEQEYIYDLFNVKNFDEFKKVINENSDLFSKLTNKDKNCQNDENIEYKKESLKTEFVDDKNFDIFPITINDIEDYKIDWKEHVCNDLFRNIEYNKILYDKIDFNNLNKVALNENIDYILVKKDMKKLKSNKSFIKTLLKRSAYLYDTYGNDLKYLSFSYSKC